MERIRVPIGVRVVPSKWPAWDSIGIRVGMLRNGLRAMRGIEAMQLLMASCEAFRAAEAPESHDALQQAKAVRVERANGPRLPAIPTITNRLF